MINSMHRQEMTALPPKGAAGAGQVAMHQPMGRAALLAAQRLQSSKCTSGIHCLKTHCDYRTIKK